MAERVGDFIELKPAPDSRPQLFLKTAIRRVRPFGWGPPPKPAEILVDVHWIELRDTYDAVRAALAEPARDSVPLALYQDAKAKWEAQRANLIQQIILLKQEQNFEMVLNPSIDASKNPLAEIPSGLKPHTYSEGDGYKEPKEMP